MATPVTRGRLIRSGLFSGFTGLAMVLAGLMIPTAAVAAPNDPITFPTAALQEAINAALKAENIGDANRDANTPVTESEA